MLGGPRDSNAPLTALGLLILLMAAKPYLRALVELGPRRRPRHDEAAAVELVPNDALAPAAGVSSPHAPSTQTPLAAVPLRASAGVRGRCPAPQMGVPGFLSWIAAEAPEILTPVPRECTADVRREPSNPRPFGHKWRTGETSPDTGSQTLPVAS